MTLDNYFGLTEISIVEIVFPWRVWKAWKNNAGKIVKRIEIERVILKNESK